MPLGQEKILKRELINHAFKIHYKRFIYLKLNSYLNMSIDNYLAKDEYQLLRVDLEENDIYNFIEELDYCCLEKSYKMIRALVNSK